MKESMADHAKKEFAESSVVKGNTMNETAQSFNQEQAIIDQAKIRAYNDKLIEWSKNPELIDKEYGKFTPMRGVVIRMFHLEMKQLEGSTLFEPIKTKILIPSQNGHGVVAITDSPYQYDTVGVVVRTSKALEKSLKPGQQIVLRNEATACRKENKEAPFELALGFSHPRWREANPPTDIEHQDYGYLVVDPQAHATCVLDEGQFAITN
jgi:hypothetical protein